MAHVQQDRCKLDDVMNTSLLTNTDHFSLALRVKLFPLGQMLCRFNTESTLKNPVFHAASNSWQKTPGVLLRWLLSQKKKVTDALLCDIGKRVKCQAIQDTVRCFSRLSGTDEKPEKGKSADQLRRYMAE